MLEESIMYYEELAASAKEQNENEMFVRGCNAAGYVHNLIVSRGCNETWNWVIGSPGQWVIWVIFHVRVTGSSF